MNEIVRATSAPQESLIRFIEIPVSNVYSIGFSIYYAGGLDMYSLAYTSNGTL